MRPRDHDILARELRGSLHLTIGADSSRSVASTKIAGPRLFLDCRPGLSRWRGGRYAWGERKSWGADVVWVTEKGDSCDPFTQDDVGGTPTSQLLDHHDA